MWFAISSVPSETARTSKANSLMLSGKLVINQYTLVSTGDHIFFKPAHPYTTISLF
jgi:hypothetical protein